MLGCSDDQFCFNYQVSFVPMKNLAVKTEKMFNPFGYGVIETERAMVLKIHGALIDLGVKYSLTFDSSSWEVEE